MWRLPLWRLLRLLQLRLPLLWQPLLPPPPPLLLLLPPSLPLLPPLSLWALARPR